MAVKKPQKGDHIVHTEITFDRVTTGKVILILSAQFVYRTPKGAKRFCMFNEDWKITQKARPKLKRSQSRLKKPA